MGRRKKQADIEEAIEDTKKPGHNGFDPEKVKSFVSRIENLYSNIDTEKSEFMLACKAIHGGPDPVDVPFRPPLDAA